MQAVIVAGGKGTRLRPLTYRTPKPMMPLFERPFLAYLVERCREVGITDIILNVHYEAEQIQAYFGDGQAFGVKIQYSVEASALDTCGAVKLGSEFFNGDPLVVFNADILTDLDLAAMIRFHETGNALGTIALARVPDPTAFGLVELEGEEQQILSFREKPTAEQAALWGIDTINAGTYILEPEVFAQVPPATPWSFERQLFPELVASSQGMRGYIHEGYWLDIGNPLKYLQSHLDILTKQMPFPLAAEEIRPQIWVAAGVEIHPEAELNAPCYLGPRTKLGPRGRIAPGVVLTSDSFIDGSVAGGIYPPGTMVLS
jgi:mannose-1-phosphate guanylyltransferase